MLRACGDQWLCPPCASVASRLSIYDINYILPGELTDEGALEQMSSILLEDISAHESNKGALVVLLVIFFPPTLVCAPGNRLK